MSDLKIGPPTPTQHRLVERIRRETSRVARELTDRQCEYVEFMRTHQREKGFPPTFREICDEFKLASTNGVYEMMRELENKGAVEYRGKKPGQSRAWFALPPLATMEGF